jgi:hypothetical protein
MEPVCAVAGFIKKPSDFSGPIFLNKEGTQGPRGYLSNMPDAAAKVSFNTLPQLVPVLLRGAGTSDDVQRRKNCLGCGGTCCLVQSGIR